MNRIKNTIVYKAIAILLVVSMLLTGVVIPSAKAEASDDSTTSINIATDATTTISADYDSWTKTAFPISALKDGEITDLWKPAYSSAFTTNMNATKTITLTFDQKAADVDKIVLYPYIQRTDGKSYGFPKSFSVSVWNGQKWVDLGSSSGHTNVMEPVKFTINEVCNCIRITTDELGPSPDGQYAFMLKELEVWGQYTDQTLLSSTSTLAKYWNNIAPYATNVSAPCWQSGATGIEAIKKLTNQYTGTNDGCASTKDYASTGSATVQLDFASDYAIDGIVLFPLIKNAGYEWYNAFPQEFTVEVGDNNGNWSPVLGVGTSEADVQGYVKDPVKVSFDATCGSKVRITATKLGCYDAADKYGLQLGEIIVLGSANIAPYSTASATDQYASYGPERLIDRNTGNFYYSLDGAQNKSKSVEFKFSNNYDMNGVVLYPRQNAGEHNGFPKAYTIEVYTGDTWKEVARETSQADASGYVNDPVKVNFDTTCGSKLRITATQLGTMDGANKYGLNLAEVNIFGSVANELYHNVESSAYEADDNVEFLYGDSVSTTGEYQATVTTDRLNNQRVYLWKPGDTHLDNEINVLDLAALMKSASGVDLPTKSGTKACDLNQDYSVDEDDMDMLRNKFLGVTIPTTSGTVYYVDSSAAAEGDGLSPETAFNTLKQVNDLKLKPGDVVLFKKGSAWSNNPLIIRDSGTANNPIIFSSYGDGEAFPVIHKNSVPDAANGAAIYGVDISHVIIENLEVTNKTDDSTKDLRGIFIESKTKTVANVTIRNCYVHDVQGNLLKAEDRRDPHHNGGIVVLAGDPVNLVANSAVQLRDISIVGNRVKDCSSLGIIAGTVKESGYYTRSVNISVRNNEVYGSQGDGILLHIVDNSVVEYNTVGFNGVCDNGQYSDKMSTCYAAVWCLGSSNVTIQHNEVYEQQMTGDAQAFDIDFWCENIIIQHNYTHENAGGFLLVMDDHKIKASHVVRYNVSKNDGHGSKSLFPVQMHKNTQYTTIHPFVEIYNNTFYFDEIQYVVSYPSTNQNTGIDGEKYLAFTNNIFYGLNEYSCSEPTGILNDNIKKGKITFDNNCFVGLTNGDLTETNISVDPQFVLYDAGADAFRLRSDSPCLGKGAR